MSYVKSLRFRLMLLCVIPLVSLAFLFIAHSVIIANQVRDISAEAYISAASADSEAARLAQNASIDMSWISGQWFIVFMVAFVCFYIPITISIKKLIVPLRRMAAYSDKLADGDIHIEVIKDRTDEIGILQESFQRLVSTSKEQAELIGQISNGDISGHYTPHSELDVVGHSLVQMLEKNNEAMSQVSISAEQLGAASAQISYGSQALASGSTQQASAIEELSATIHEISYTIKENREMVSDAVKLASGIRASAAKGSQQIKEMVDAVKDIRAASNNIQTVMKVIDDIAFQTNILALNAAVEAARAGQHGKGFAVVAQEVRNLASSSAEAAKNTGSLIVGTIEKAELGVRIADQTAANFGDIEAGIQDSGKLFEEISRYAKIQLESISQINESIDQISQVVQQNSATAEESAASCVEMSMQCQHLNEVVSHFHLRQQ